MFQFMFMVQLLVNLDFSFKSYGKESLYTYCMNVDDGRIIFLAFCFVPFALLVVVLCDSCVPNAASVSGLQPTRHLKNEEVHNCPLA